jgi:hypothetical protein
VSVVDHPLRHANELNRRIVNEFGDRVCWRTGPYLGSMFLLDFGSRRTLLGPRGPVELGELVVSVEDVSWFIERAGQIVLTSDQIEAGRHEMLDPIFLGRRLLRVDWGVHCSLIFSEDVALRCDRTDAYANDGDQIVELRFANDDYVDCYASGAIHTERALQ